MKTLLVCGDALEELRKLPDNSVELILTDPPYGLDIAKSGHVGGAGKNFIGKLVESRDYGKSDWDTARPSQEVFQEMMRVSKNQIIFGANHFCSSLPDGKKWIVWDKKATGNFSKCELIFTSFTGAVDKIEWEWNGFIQGDGRGGRVREKRFHPSQKPLGLIRLLIERHTKSGDLVMDPFAGSGTTAVACLGLGRRCFCVEKQEKYIKIIEDRLSHQKVLL